MFNNKSVKIIPSAITCLNLTFGFLAILVNEPEISCLLIMAGAVMDIFDGLAARMLNATSELGKQLDSLADLVTFGIAPAFLMYAVMPHNWLGLMAANCIPVGAAIRLARFNICTDQTLVFKGLPSPSNGLFFAAFPLLVINGFFSEGCSSTFIILPVFFAVLMNLNIPFFSLKTLKFGIRNNLALLALILISAVIVTGMMGLTKTNVLVAILGSIPFIILAYFLVSVLFIKQIRKTATLGSQGVH